jgi:hypothetical protein
MGGGGVHSVLIGRPEGKIPLERPRRRWEDNINWIGLTRDRVQWRVCDHGNEPSDSIKKAGYCLEAE